MLAGQRAATQRLQTLTQLFHLTDLSQEALPELLLEHREALRLATRLGYPEREPLRLVVAFDELALAPTPDLLAMRDTLLTALRAYDALGGGPQPSTCWNGWTRPTASWSSPRPTGRSSPSAWPTSSSRATC